MHLESIAAISTAFGTAGISVIRISGESAISEFNKIFKGRDLNKVKIDIYLNKVSIHLKHFQSLS